MKRRIETPKGCGKAIHAVTSPAWCFSLTMSGSYVSNHWDAIYQGTHKGKEGTCGHIHHSQGGNYKVIWLCIECCVNAGLLW